jgi:hypothetical protein
MRMLCLRMVLARMEHIIRCGGWGIVSLTTFRLATDYVAR